MHAARSVSSDMKNSAIDSSQEATALIDLSTDVMTEPTEKMWHAMLEAKPGMASAGRDLSVNRLEQMAAQMMGKEAALFAATGSLANLLSLLAHADRGEQVILAEDTHILCCEEWGIATVCGLLPRPVRGIDGALEPGDVERAITQRHYRHLPPTGLVCIENSSDSTGGTIVTPAQTAQICATAQRHGVPIHLDGSRIFNAAIALGVDVRALVDPVDSVMFSISKGLSAPMGSLLCGSQNFVDQARHHLRVLGAGSLHKLGFAAAAGIVALETMIARLADDNRRARMLAEGLSEVQGLRIDLKRVQTNIVMVDVTDLGCSGEMCQAELEKRRVRTHLRSTSIIRLVTHRHIGDEEVGAAIAAFRQVAQSNMTGHTG